MNNPLLEACQNQLKGAQLSEIRALIVVEILREKYSIPKDVFGRIWVEAQTKAEGGYVPMIFTEDHPR